ncbi:MAG: hypothetical protein ABIE74_04385 [Pseudomonadota bacterium]
MKLSDFSDNLQKSLGDNLRSIVLYGSAVGKDFSEKFSDYNLILILNDTNLKKISPASSLIEKWCKGKNPPPLIFDSNHINTSLDVFPLEFLDIKRRHETLYGEDPFKDIAIDRKNLRHQCESELKGKLIHLRSFYATHSKSSKELENILLSSFTTFMAIMRGILQLLGIEPAQSNEEVVDQLADKISFDREIFKTISAARMKKNKLPKDEMNKFFTEYLTQIEKITNYVDKFNT